MLHQELCINHSPNEKIIEEDERVHLDRGMSNNTKYVERKTGKHPDPCLSILEQKFHLHIDASGIALGVVLV